MSKKNPPHLDESSQEVERCGRLTVAPLDGCDIAFAMGGLTERQFEKYKFVKCRMQQSAKVVSFGNHEFPGDGRYSKIDPLPKLMPGVLNLDILNQVRIQNY